MLFHRARTLLTHPVIFEAGTFVAGLTQQQTNGRIEIAQFSSLSADEESHRQLIARNLFGTYTSSVSDKQCRINYLSRLNLGD